MGETDTEGGKGGDGGRIKKNITLSAFANYRAPTVGLKRCLFIVGTSKSAATFKDTLKKSHAMWESDPGEAPRLSHGLSKI